MSHTLFAHCIPDGDEDAVDDILDVLFDQGISDSDWEWLKWTDPKGRIFVVVRGTLATRGAFHTADIGRPVRLSVAHRWASENRSEWSEPKNASDGRAQLDAWLSDAGITPLTDAEIEAAERARRELETPTLILQGRKRLEQIAVPLDDAIAEAERLREEAAGGGADRRGGAGFHQPQKSGTTNSVLEAFSQGIQGLTDETGKSFSLFKMRDEADAPEIERIKKPALPAEDEPAPWDED